ncbi:MAG: HD domain-containing protein [Thermodesulfobacteriota bacterium]
MTQPFKDAVSICKTVMRNGFDAYVINARLQDLALGEDRETELDIATEADFEALVKLFPSLGFSRDPSIIGVLREGGAIYRFYPTDVEDGSHSEDCLSHMTPRLLKRLEEMGEVPPGLACPYVPKAKDRYEGFADFSGGQIRLTGLPDETLRRDYLKAIRAMRYAANYQLPIEPNTWMAIIRGAQRILDYVSVSDIMDEWRKVEAENMWEFVRLLFDCQILHGLIPEVAALARVRQMKNEAEEETVLAHTLEVMRRYPEELPYDWFGALACLFHDVGKLYTAEFFEGKWTFYQHHRVGAKVTRRIMNRLRFEPQETDLVCHLVRQHMRFHFMLTDRGIRRFKALDEYPRLIELFRADLKARGAKYTEFNHNMKMLGRADAPEETLEPLLNGNEIMEFTGLKPGPSVGLIREALLKAQIAGDVNSIPEAVEYVQRYRDRELA